MLSQQSDLEKSILKKQQEKVEKDKKKSTIEKVTTQYKWWFETQGSDTHFYVASQHKYLTEPG